jgi:deazaflavin-dependent oxidoreductase (nitroreductase family)
MARAACSLSAGPSLAAAVQFQQFREVAIMTDAHILTRYRAPSIVAAVNPLIRRLIRAGLPFGPNVLLTVRGRSSGQVHTFPVAVMDAGGRRFISSPYGEVNWVRNLRVHPQAVITKGSRKESVDAVEIAPEDAVVVLRAGLARYLRSPVLTPLVRLFTGIRPDSTDEEILAHARRHPMFELRPRVAES